MRNNIIIRLFSLLLFVVTTNVQAVPLRDLFNGQNIVIGDKNFADWTLFDIVATDGAPDLGLIDVIELNDDPLHTGLQFNGNDQLSVRDDNFIDLFFGFSVATLNNRSLHCCPING